MQFKRILPGSFVLCFKEGEEVTQGLLFFAKKMKLKSAWLSGLGGFVCRAGRDYILHAHATLSDSQFKAHGGHLFSGKVSATCEVFVTEIKKIERVLDKKVGLKLMRLN